MSQANATQRPLKVLVVGGGIGGLTAALGLRRQGHEVQVFERSAMLNEHGNAISIAPNANTVLRRFGLYLENFDGVLCRGSAEYEKDRLVNVVPIEPSKLMSVRDAPEGGKAEVEAVPWHFMLRADLHKALRQVASSTDGAGKPVSIRPSSKVVRVDPVEGSVFLDNGEKFTGDVVVGADGIHSVTKNALPGCEDLKPVPYAVSAFRFICPMEQVKNDPLTKEFIERDGYFIMMRHDTWRVITYPCAGGKLMNVVTTAPSNLYDASLEDPENRGEAKRRVIELFGTWGAKVKALLEKSDPESTRMWTFYSMERPSTWSHGKMVLLGDAPHPFLPFAGQGAAQAIEDVSALFAVLTPDVKPEAVNERFKLYEQIRYERAHAIQDYAYEMGMSEVKDKERKMSSLTMDGHNFHSHDPWAAAQRVLEAS